MSNYRYSFSFIISSIIFTLMGFSLLLLAQKVEKPKKLSMSVIKVAIINPPIVKKVREKKPIPPVVAPPIPTPPKVYKKIKHKKVIKKKKRVKKKKIIKKKVIKKKITKKRIIKKKVVKKRVIKKKHILKKVEPIVEPVVYQPIQEVYIPTPQPKRVVVPVVKAPVERKALTPKIDKSAEKRQFLSQVRSQIIANKRYPRIALKRHIQGSVKVKFDITASGNVSNIHYLNGKTILQKGARKAIEKSFPISIPSDLRSELPINDIYLTIHFNIH